MFRRAEKTLLHRMNTSGFSSRSDMEKCSISQILASPSSTPISYNVSAVHPYIVPVTAASHKTGVCHLGSSAHMSLTLFSEWSAPSEVREPPPPPSRGLECPTCEDHAIPRQYLVHLKFVT